MLGWEQWEHACFDIFYFASKRFHKFVSSWISFFPFFFSQGTANNERHLRLPDHQTEDSRKDAAAGQSK